jgi:hypothetical protein
LHLSLGRAPGTLAEQALKRIAALYAIEADIRGRPPDERRRQRQMRAGPLLEAFHAWLSALVGRVLRISANVTDDFGSVTDLERVLGCADLIVGMRSV